MREKILCCLFLLFICGAAVAQNKPNQDAARTELAIDQIKKTVVFLQTSWSDFPNGPNQQPQIKSMIGTGFLIFVPVPELGKDASGSDRGLDFLVTAKHMIRQKTSANQPAPYADNVLVRFNTLAPVDATGKRWKGFDARILDERGDLQWFVDDSDPVADVALTPIFLDETAEFKTIPLDFFATKSFVSAQHVNENDEVLFTGLFTGYFGAQKKLPYRTARTACVVAGGRCGD